MPAIKERLEAENEKEIENRKSTPTRMDKGTNTRISQSEIWPKIKVNKKRIFKTFIANTNAIY